MPELHAKNNGDRVILASAARARACESGGWLYRYNASAANQESHCRAIASLPHLLDLMTPLAQTEVRQE